jgi:hypothetical protein
MKRVRDATASILDGTTLADVNQQTATMRRIGPAQKTAAKAARR